MATESGHSKRPMCPSCSKPTRFCLCTRLKTPCLQNSVAVTILQHSLEKKHPLNSTRIASIGLQNLSVITVSDVNYEAQFLIHFLNSNLEMGSLDLDERSSGSCGSINIRDSNFDRTAATGSLQNQDLNKQYNQCLLNSNLEMGSQNLDEQSGSSCGSINVQDTNFDCSAAIAFSTEKYGAICPSQNQDLSKHYNQFLLNSNDEMGSQILDEKTSGSCDINSSINIKHSNFDYNGALAFTIEKYGAVCPSQKQDLSKLFECREAIDDIRKGFLVKKIERKPLNGSSEYQELKEFEVAVPPGSVLLFPSENSIGMEEIDFEVKNLIVLDGTWPKAKRMYNENPWLKLLPHVRLEVEKLSLYSEVRHQPKAGYLSTIESIVYSLKGIGEENSEGLDQLLDVFESMVGDQRRCKDEGLKRKLSNLTKI